MLIGLKWAQALFVIIFKAGFDEFFSLAADPVSFRTFCGELHFNCVQNDTFPQYFGLSISVSEWFLSIEHFKENDSYRPNINFWGYMWLTLVKNFRRKIPVCSNSRRSKVNLCLFVLNGFANSKVYDFDETSMENDIGWLQIEMNDLHLLLMKIFYRKNQLPDDLLGLFLL